ncbi:MAG TPA: tetratricopeptide repeat protein [Myxococcaceae bacterium]|nr:tetratricopeptide repeat protein [Myxococcaceae bacterium]
MGRRTWAVRVVLVCALGAVAEGCEPKRDPKAEAEGHYLKGQSEYLRGNFDAALAAFAEVKRLNPDEPKLPVAIGEVYLAQGKLPDAQKQFEAAVVRDPKRATSWSRLGYIQAQLGQVEAARGSLERALRLNPSDFNALEARAELAIKAGDVDAAVRDYAAAGRLAPEPSRPGLYLKAASLLDKRNRRKEAQAVLEDAVGHGAKSAELFSLLGDLRVKAGELSQAAEAYEQAALLSPKDAGPWELVGRIRARLQQPEEAEAAFRESLKVEDRTAVHVELARLALQRDDRQGAQAELDKALSAGGATDATAAEMEDLAELLLVFDRKKDALALYKLLAGEPDAAGNVELQLKLARLARELKDRAVQDEACARVTAARGKRVACP